MSDKEYWNRIFHEFRTALADEARVLPSVSLIAQETENNPFAVLVSTVISLRTKDEVTLSSSRRLLDAAPDAAHLAAMDEAAIQALIFPCGFFKRKARQLKTIAQTLISRFDGKVPSYQECESDSESGIQHSGNLRRLSCPSDSKPHGMGEYENTRGDSDGS